MAKINIPRLVPKVRATKTYWYWVPSATLARSGWTQKPLGTDEFAAATLARAENEKVEEWRRGGAVAAHVRKFKQKGTVATMIHGFLADVEKRVAEGTMSASTLKEYRSKCGIVERWAGKEQAIHVTDANVRKFRDALMKPIKGEIQHNRAAGTLRVGRTLFAYGEREGFIPKGSNPFVNPGIAAPPPRDQFWSQMAIDAFCQDASPAINLAINLAREIGQRPQDLRALMITQWTIIPQHKLDRDTWQALAEPDPDGTLCVRGISLRQKKGTRKGRRWIEVPVVGETRRKVERGIAIAKQAGLLTILNEAAEDRATTLEWAARRRDGEKFAAEVTPWTETRLARAIQDQREKTVARLQAAGDVELADEIAELQFRDLRRTGVVWLGEMGIEDHLIAAITAHSLDHTKKILETYMPRTTKMAARAIVYRLERTAKPEEPKEKTA